MKNIEKLLISPVTSILEALKIIDKGSVQIALVVDNEQRLIGTLTDGDIRRGILRGIDLNREVSLIMKSDPTVSYVDDSRDIIFSKMKHCHLKHIPVIDQHGRVVRLDLLDEIITSERCDNWVVLMAGGLGTRLGELTRDCPKPLLKVGSKPILEVILENFISNGFYRFIISVNYKAEMIIDYFGDGSKWGVEIVYVQETKRLGTAGALSLLPFVPDKPIIVMNGDLLTKINFQQLIDFHAETKASATMCVREYEFQVPYGVVKVDNFRLESIEEKPLQRFFISGGIYVISPDALQHIPSNTFYDMPTLFEKLLQSKAATSAFPIREYWIDIGRADDFERANIEYEEGIMVR
ncbi:nucleotidyltransferase family protein [Paenibacillus radicis (ex Gao et al. 2016)]|uniref:Alcohol dehydrogenase n=1 Tax=Paenibacillus radicis (ex Gao et al. 2016) TaxID=1737354 RepID=A0A917HMI5_9BACL|nr:nucleotidyltransferase family protein [Paenibacillus radicis (ex Gao et al. 2016)]GGG84536.1 alcohol dehydrogenase [Paenibacillus radicis (ex Gao et al. 2016)]